MKRNLITFALVLIAPLASAQTVAAQRAQHNASVCSLIAAAEGCQDADVVLALCGFSSGPTGVPQSQIDSCAVARPHAQRVYQVDAAFRSADDAVNQAARVASQKQAYSARIHRLVDIAFKAGGQGCINLLTALGIADTAVCGK